MILWKRVRGGPSIFTEIITLIILKFALDARSIYQWRFGEDRGFCRQVRGFAWGQGQGRGEGGQACRRGRRFGEGGPLWCEKLGQGDRGIIVSGGAQSI